MLKLLNQELLIPWNNLGVGMSVFVPYLDAAKTEKAVRTQASFWGYEVVCKHQRENGRLGLRVWRVA